VIYNEQTESDILFSVYNFATKTLTLTTNNGYNDKKYLFSLTLGQSYKRSSSFLKPACILISLEAFFKSYKKFDCLDFFAWGSKKASSSRTLNIWLNLGLKPQERVTQKILDLGQASELGLFNKPLTHVYKIHK